ncbi:MAG: DNA polymerase/3'-5' exonuclease PolX [Candidatus Sungbacteria bacterium]|nr:DNA polymerase/3'-5' exonuclease PolX [Candidatus Sungbacteria bacterium]
MANSEVAKILMEMAALYEMSGVLFKPRAYEKAALNIEAFGEDIADLFKQGGKDALKKIPGVGEGIAMHLAEFFKKGHFKEYDRLKKKTPIDIAGLTAIEGVGPRMVKTLWEKLKIRNIEDLEKAAKAGKIRGLAGFGEKSEEKILKGIEFLKESGGRRILGNVLPDIRRLEAILRAFPEVEKLEIAGSARRRKETIGDIDILVSSKKPESVIERFLALPMIAHVFGKGTTKTSVKLKDGLDADLRVIPQKSWGAALNYFTGSKDHNIALRELAQKQGWKLSEYGLFKGEKMIAGKTEEELYKKLGLRYIEPELREMHGEIEAARENKLPKLIGYDDLKGDLQVQTDWTDGKDSIEKMAEAAIEVGLQYIVITDHTRSLAMTGGADEKKLLQQMEEIEKINKHLKNFRILKGAEVNIGKDGSLDIDDETLAKLDVVGAAVHSHFNLSQEEQTQRVIRAMENPNVDIIFHLTGRIINRRDAIHLDVEKIIKAAKRTGTVLEIDAFPDRLDIKDDYIKKCVEAGVKMSIDSDAHAAAHFSVLEYGIAQARRGWAEKKDIINAWPMEKMLGFLKK